MTNAVVVGARGDPHGPAPERGRACQRGKGSVARAPRSVTRSSSRGHAARSVEFLERQAAAGCPSSFPSATAGCWSRRSPSTVARRFMASDLASTPRSGSAVCGDAHLRTSGSSPRRSGAVFDVNDFDETLPGPWEWDVKRLAASVAIAGAGPRVHRQGGPGRGVRPVPATGGDGPVGPMSTAGRLVLPHRRRRAARANSRPAGQIGRRTASAPARSWQGPTRDSLQALDKLTAGGRRPTRNHQ